MQERVEEKEGIPPIQQRLIYNGKHVRSARTHARPPRIAVASVPVEERCFHFISTILFIFSFCLQMSDDKTAADYNLEGGATLHLVVPFRA